MKKAHVEEIPFEVHVKLREMRRVKSDIHKALSNAVVREEKGGETRLKSTMRETAKSVMRTGAEPMSLKLKMTHCLGDVYGRFHPSKSKKGIKRSE